MKEKREEESELQINRGKKPNQKLKPYLEAVLKGSKVPFQKEENKPYPEIPDPDNYNW